MKTLTDFDSAATMVESLLRADSVSPDMVHEQVSGLRKTLPSLVSTAEDKARIRALADAADDKAFQFEVSRTALEDGCYDSLFSMEVLFDEASLTERAHAYHGLSDALWDAAY